MSTTTVTGQSIVAGYEWRQRVEASSLLFPDGATYTAQVRATAASATVMATITTAGGGVVRITDRVIELVIPGSSSTLWTGEVVLDLVRTDTNPDLHMGFFLTVPVVQPVTRL
jgi:hypothetical protein